MTKMFFITKKRLLVSHVVVRETKPESCSRDDDMKDNIGSVVCDVSKERTIYIKESDDRYEAVHDTEDLEVSL